MNGFLHNAVADLYGPYFLLFYALAIVALIVAARRSIRAVDRSLELEPPEIPAKLDPYEVAYLRGGENEVTRVAIASLIQRGLLRIDEDKRWHSTIRKIGRGRSPEPRELVPVEAAVRAWKGYPASPAEIFGTRGVASRVKEICGRYEIDLAEEHLLAPRDEMKSLAIKVWSFGLAVMILLGAYKLAVAHAKGHSNVMFLYGLIFIGATAYSLACWAMPRVSRRGKLYLERLRQTFGGLGSRLDTSGDWALAPDAAGRADPRAMARAAAVAPECLLMLGIFGIPALSTTPLSVLNTMFTQSANSGCGGGGCGGGGCGGGGCGGGGCGGCGG